MRSCWVLAPLELALVAGVESLVAAPVTPLELSWETIWLIAFDAPAAPCPDDPPPALVLVPFVLFSGSGELGSGFSPELAGVVGWSLQALVVGPWYWVP